MGGRREVWKRGGGGCVGTQSGKATGVSRDVCSSSEMVSACTRSVVLYHIQVYLDIKLFLYMYNKTI